MKLRPSALTLLVMLLLTACGQNGNNLRIKIDGTNKDFRIVSSQSRSGTKVFSYQENGKLTSETACSTTIELNNGSSLRPSSSIASKTESLEKSDRVKIQIKLTGEKGTSGTTPVQIKRYEIDQNRFSTVSEIILVYFNEDDEKRVVLESSNSKGFVEIDSAKDGVISGSIEVRSDEVTIQGKFQAYGNNFQPRNVEASKY